MRAAVRRFIMFKSVWVMVLLVTVSLGAGCSKESTNQKNSTETSPPSSDSKQSEASPPAKPESVPPQPTADEPSLAFQFPSDWTRVDPPGDEIRYMFELATLNDNVEGATVEISFHAEMDDLAFEQEVERWGNRFLQTEEGSRQRTLKQSAVFGTTHRTTLLDVHGNYQHEELGVPVGEPKQNYRLLMARIETEQGPWLVKLLGPAQAVSHWEGSLATLLKTTK